jgi:hypothetical protein
MKKLILPFAALLIVIVFMNAAPKEYTKITYLDRNNCKLEITPTTISYIPISKAESSSGMFDGGEPWKKEIDNDVWFEINSQIKAHIENKKNILKERVKPSVAFVLEQGKKKKTVIATYNAELDEYLKSLKTLKTKMD